MQSLNKLWAGDLIASIFMDEGKISKTYSLHLYFQELKKGFSGRELWDLLSLSFLIRGWKDIFNIGKNRKSCCLLCYPFVFVKKNSLSYFYFWERDCNMFGQVRPKGIFWRAFHKFAKESFPSISAFNKTQKIAEKAKRLNERQKWRKKRKSSPSKARV